MGTRSLFAIGAAFFMCSAALAQDAADPYADFSKRAQERLKALGFYTGPVNGDIGPNTQAAIAQFQLSVPLPASGSLDEATIAALGVQPPESASAGASAEQVTANGNPAR